MSRLLLGLLGVFLLFQWSASVLGSDRGQAGLLVAALVVAATLAVERAWFTPTIRAAALAIGLGRPRARGLVVASVISLLLFLVVFLFVRVTGAVVSFERAALSLIPGLFAQGGIAEETLFRGYLFGHLRQGRSFWRAAWLSMLPFIAVHALLFFTMPWFVALAALLLSVVLSFPLAQLFELGGRTMWAPALLHFVVQGTVKVLIISGEGASAFPFVWMLASAVVPMLAFTIPRQSDVTPVIGTGHRL
jgi:membrane protease YdiL (CAAX protease family)